MKLLYITLLVLAGISIASPMPGGDGDTGGDGVNGDG